MKILQIVNQSSYNGATVYAYRLCKKLTEYEQELLSCFNGNAYDDIVNSGVSCNNLLISKEVSYKYLLSKYWKFIRFIRKNNYDIIHYHQGGIGILLLAYFFKKKATVIHHLHSRNLIGDNTKLNISIFHLKILKYLSDRTYQIAVAEHIFNQYNKKIGNASKLQLIRNSTPFVFEKKQMRGKKIGFIGRFTKEKGFSTLAGISVKLNERIPDLIIYTMGGELELFNKNFNGLVSNLKLIDPELNTENFYKNLDLLLFLSKAPEGMPLVVLEAISFDVGVIAYPLPALKEILGDDYPLYVNNYDMILNVISSYYENKINLNDLTSIHKDINRRFNENAMLNLIREFYVKFENKNNL
jgi:glycosyltransferase involved in cell wall biosynthesis